MAAINTNTPLMQNDKETQEVQVNADTHMKTKNQSAGGNPANRRSALEEAIEEPLAMAEYKRGDTVLAYFGARFWLRHSDDFEADGVPIDLVAQYLPAVLNKLDWKRADEGDEPFLGLCYELAEALQFDPRHKVV